MMTIASSGAHRINKKTLGSSEPSVSLRDAGPTGLEPATSALTGRRSNQAELRSRSTVMCGPKRDRTADLFNAIEALSQLSYGPVHEKRSTNIAVSWNMTNTDFILL